MITQLLILRQVAELTGLRSRDQLLAQFMVCLRAIFASQEVRLLRFEDAAWHSLDAQADLPNDVQPLGHLAARHQAMARERIVSTEGGLPMVCFPVGNACVVEVMLPAPTTEAQLAQAEEAMRVFRNVVGLLDYGERDSLTGLLNRKTFDEAFMRMACALEGGQQVSGSAGQRRWSSEDASWLAVIDIDHFKLVNDVHGHLVGDEVLLLVSQLMRDALRQSDLVYRFGGEEFVALLTCGEADGMRSAMERLRLRIAEHEFPRVAQLTVSVGFTCIGSDDTPEAAFGRADKAVYAAKQAGRNCVIDAGDLPEGEIGAQESVESAVEFF